MKAVRRELMAQKMKPMMKECFMIQSKNTKNPEIWKGKGERERGGGIKPSVCPDMIGWRWLDHSLIWKSLIQRGNTIWQNTQNLFSEFTWWCCYTRSGWVLCQSASCELVLFIYLIVELPLVLSFPTGVCFHYKLLIQFIPFVKWYVYKRNSRLRNSSARSCSPQGTIFLSHATLWALMGSVSLGPIISNKCFNYFSFKSVSTLTWTLNYYYFLVKGSIHYLVFLPVFSFSNNNVVKRH